jgi:hypothetical protein
LTVPTVMGAVPPSVNSEVSTSPAPAAPAARDKLDRRK